MWTKTFITHFSNPFSPKKELLHLSDWYAHELFSDWLYCNLSTSRWGQTAVGCYVLLFVTSQHLLAIFPVLRTGLESELLLTCNIKVWFKRELFNPARTRGWMFASLKSETISSGTLWLSFLSRWAELLRIPSLNFIFSKKHTNAVSVLPAFLRPFIYTHSDTFALFSDHTGSFSFRNNATILWWIKEKSINK